MANTTVNLTAVCTIKIHKIQINQIKFQTLIIEFIDKIKISESTLLNLIYIVHFLLTACI